MGLKKTRLILLLGLGDPRSRWIFSEPDSSREFYWSIRDWGYEIVHNSLASTLPLHWVFQHGFQMRPPSPILQCLRPKCLLSRFLPHTKHNRGIYLARLEDKIDGVSIGLLAEIGWYSTIVPNGITVPLNGAPNRRCLPIR